MANIYKKKFKFTKILTKEANILFIELFLKGRPFQKIIDVKFLASVSDLFHFDTDPDLAPDPI